MLTSIPALGDHWSQNGRDGANSRHPLACGALLSRAAASSNRGPQNGQNSTSDGARHHHRQQDHGHDNNRTFGTEGGPNYLEGGLLSWRMRLIRSAILTLMGSLWLLSLMMMVVTLGSIRGVVSR